MRTSSIGHTVRMIISDVPGEEETRSMARLCERIALVYLSGKLSKGRLDPERFGLTLNDLATDSVADLFQRTPEGQYRSFKRYFCPIKDHLVTDAEYLGALRRLLFNHINQHLFRLHREFDPSLGKIIRNIKLAVKRIRHLHLGEVLGEPWILDAEDLKSDHEGVLMPPEVLERMLAPALCGNGTMIHALEEFRSLLVESPSYRKAYPLVGLGLVLRRIMSHLGDLEQVPETRLDRGLTVEDIRSQVSASVGQIRQSMLETYVTKEKMSPETYNGYFAALRNLFNERYAGEDGVDLSYFDFLNSAIGPMDRGEYMRKHRVRFEYLAKLTRRELIRRIEKDL